LLRLKPQLQALSKRLGFHNRLKSSRLYDIYWSIADRSLIDDRRRELRFYRSLLRGFRPGDLIFDIGANQGVKTDIFLRLGARVIAVDPDEVNRAILEEKFVKYRLVPKSVVIVQKAASDRNASEMMWIDEPGSAMNTFSQKWVEALRTDGTRFGRTLNFVQSKQVITTTLEELFTSYGVPFFIKLDIEGHEIMALRGMRRPVPYLSFEVNLPEFRAEGLECIELLSRLEASGQFNYAIDCRQGLVRKEWLGREAFVALLRHCSAKSVEVFWRTSPVPNCCSKRRE
jgi:FkbM family methyltransferase